VTEIGRALPPVRPRPPAWHLFMPKLVTAFREGCGSADLRSDSIAGLAVAIVGLGDRAVLILTFGSAAMVDRAVAIEMGAVLAATLFMHRMAEVVSVQQGIQLIEEDVDDFARPQTDYTQYGSQPSLQFADSFEAALSSTRQAP